MITSLDVKKELSDWFISESILFEWAECQQVLVEKLAKDALEIVALPILACLTVGGTINVAVPPTAAWAMLRYASELLDAVQDRDELPEGVSDPSTAISYANGLIFSAYRVIAAIDDQQIGHQLTETFSDLAFQASLGQWLSERSRRQDEVTLETYWQATILKSGSIFRAGFDCGSIVGKANSQQFQALSDFGSTLGVIRQIIDDCRDVIDDPDYPGVSAYEVTLPLLLLAETESVPVSALIARTKTDVPLGTAFQAHGIPEIITEILMEWYLRAEQSLKYLSTFADTKPLKEVLHKFTISPFQNYSND